VQTFLLEAGTDSKPIAKTIQRLLQELSFAKGTFFMSLADVGVSVIIPVYNGERFLLEAVRNVQAQGHDRLEIIVIDDGSTDATPAILEGLGNQVRAVRQPNSGPSAARNHGLKLSQGNFIAFHDVDDLWEAGALKALLDAFDAHPDAEIVQGLIQRMELQRGRDSKGLEFQASGEPYQFINLGSALIRREVFHRVGLLDESLRENEDTDWFLRAWEQNVTKIVLPRLVLHYRIHDRNLVHSQRLVAGGMLRMLKRHLDRERRANGAGHSLPATIFPIAAFIGSNTVPHAKQPALPPSPADG